MKKVYIAAIGMLGLGMTGQAQDTYLNERLTNTSDLTGTARYVGMGGALGALGADISVMSSNPAGIGLFRKTNLAGTVSLLTQADRQSSGESLTRFSFDNLGVAVALPISDFGGLRYFNFGVNYQKKANYNHVLTANNPNTRGLSQTDQMVDLSNTWGTVDDEGNVNFPSELIGTAYNAWLFDGDGPGGYYGYGAQSNAYTRVTRGSLQGFDFDFSFNVRDRYYFGLTVGIDRVDYESHTAYGEVNFRDGEQPGTLRDEGYGLFSDQDVKGYGYNVKFGTILRPFEDSPFRVGLAIETPTFYHLESTSWYQIESPFDENGNYTEGLRNRYRSPSDNYLEYELRTPWKFRASLGHTVGNVLALGAEYEYADYSFTRMSYPSYDWYDGYWESYWEKNSEKDHAMNRLTSRSLRGVHSAKFGLETRLTDQVSLRAGYNYYSKVYEKDARLDQNIDSYAMTVNTGTAYMNTGDVNILTVGLGYRGKHFFADMAYKYRRQQGSFYAFDDSFSSKPDFAGTDVAGVKLDPVDVNLDRHQVCFTVGYKF